MTGTATKRVLSGIKPTGELHLGNYAGAIRPCIQYSTDPNFEMLLMCADWHGLTDRKMMQVPGTNTLSTLATFVALGFQFEWNALFLQSDFPEIQENAWYLSCVTAVGMLERSHAYKDAIASGKKPTAGLFYYPVLMASDIVSFDSDLVPVGKDQAQHLEYMSDLVKLFNNAVEKPVYKIATPLIMQDALLVGIDGERKMSKSYQNHIPLFAAKKEIEKKIKEIKTDSAGLDDPKNPGQCAVFQILKSFGSVEAIEYMRERLLKGKGYGYGHAKADLLAEHERVFGSKRDLYDHMLHSTEEIKKLIEPGYSSIEAYAKRTTERARQSLGLSTFRK